MGMSRRAAAKSGQCPVYLQKEDAMSMKIQRVRPCDLKEFDPLMSLAREKARELLARDGQLHYVSHDKVEIRRQDQLATIDTFGRVTWRPFH
jgi:hypothetical protein